jgi:PhnB protein
MAKVKPVPDGYPRVSPGLSIDGAAAAIGHAELEIGDSVIMLGDEYPEMGFRSPKAIGGTPVTLNVYVDDVDKVFARALAEGATSLRPVENQFYGDRSGSFEDPFGHRWNVATHVEDVPPDEMEKRAAAAMGAG